MKSNLPVAPAVFALFIVGVTMLNTPPSAFGSAPRSVVRFALRLERAAPADLSAAPGADASPPSVLGTPTVTTFDRDTATVAITNTAFSYSVALSPVVEAARTSGDKTTDATVQTS